MASRLYRTTRRLYEAVEAVLRALGVPVLGTPTWAMLLGWVVTGLILLDARPTQTRVARLLPGRCHDALNRWYRLMPFSSRALMGLLMAYVKRLGQDGYLVLDDVIIEKAFAQRLAWAGWTYSFAKKRKVYGLHVVVLLWCAGPWRIPVGFRLWRPKRSCAPHRYRTKLELGLELVIAVVAARLPVRYVVADTVYTAGWFSKRLARLGLIWHGTLAPATTLVWQGQRQAVRAVAVHLKLKWRGPLGLRAAALTLYAPKYGTLRLVVTRNRHGNYEYLVSNARQADLTTLVLRKRSRWSVETAFRDTKQFAGLGACQCWVDQAMVRHVGVVLLAFVVLQRLRLSPAESLAAVKERWQLTALQDGQAAPIPLRACPRELRVAA
ncbi:MAG TPA: transposase [Candidatus Competibacteraceae bacterium]|nr:transposase [Candidatus Competibacteraceae bacterium]